MPLLSHFPNSLSELTNTRRPKKISMTFILTDTLTTRSQTKPENDGPTLYRSLLPQSSTTY